LPQMTNFLILLFALIVVFIVIRYVISRIIGDYKKRARVMNTSERELYLILQKELGGKYIVLSKVRIEDFVDVSKNGLSWNDEQSLRGRIKSRHVDFLICDLSSTEPLYAIELDGASHLKDKTIERDRFVDRLYKKIGLPMTHITVGSNFAKEVEEIKNLLLE